MRIEHNHESINKIMNIHPKTDRPGFLCDRHSNVPRTGDSYSRERQMAHYRIASDKTTKFVKHKKLPATTKLTNRRQKVQSICSVL